MKETAARHSADGSSGKPLTLRRSLPVLLCALLSACAQSETALVRASMASSPSAQQALALPPPGAPAVIGVVERRYANAIQQEISLATDSSVPGQNLLRVQLFGSMGREAGDTRLPDRMLSQADIGREMRQLLPGVAMQRSPLYAQNGYGPFGYAIGRSGIDLCIYAWQRISGTQAGAPFANIGSAQIRLRVCRSGASERGLLAIMYGYTINASLPGGWNPHGVPAPDPRLGAPGQVIVPAVSSSGYDTMLDPPVAAAPPPAQQPRRARRPAAAPPPPSPPPGAPIVPPPPAAAATATGVAPVVPPPPAAQ